MRKIPEAPQCPAVAMLQRVIGGKWKLNILFYITFMNQHRFGQLRRSVEGISESTLSKQLKELAQDALIERVDFAELPPHVEYKLTERGESFRPLLLALWDWSESTFDYTPEERVRMDEIRASIKCQ
jgi:DNA-binding HxlR family transcriptional regulator